MMIGPTHFIKARRQSEHTCMPRYMAIMRRLITEIVMMEFRMCEMETHSVELKRLEILEKSKVEWTWFKWKVQSKREKTDWEGGNAVNWCEPIASGASVTHGNWIFAVGKKKQNQQPQKTLHAGW